MRTKFCTVVLVALILATWACSTTGACLNYGHSCLGAHGRKRAEVPPLKGSFPAAPYPAMGLLGPKGILTDPRAWSKRIPPKGAPRKFDNFWRI